jgi:tetratricopeptide (TPR) repeat protein
LIRATYWLPGVLVLLALAARQAHGQAPAGDVALAEALFQEGRKLMEQKRFAEACPKLAESQRLDPAGGTLLRLALCREQEGKTATAWVELQQALAQAQRDRHQERVAMAQQALDRVTPRLVKLAVVVPPEVARLPGLLVRRNGVELAPAAWGVSFAVDPGEQRIEATAPGHEPFLKTTQLTREGNKIEVIVAPLRPAPSSGPPAAVSSPEPVAPPPEPPPPAAPSRTGGLPAASYALGGVGLVALGVGGYFGLSALSKQKEALDRCPQSPCSDRGGVDRNEAARRDAWVANVGVGVGLVAVGIGVYLALRGSPGASAARLAPTPGGATVLGRF